MIKIAIYKKDNGRVLVVYKTIKGNLIGEIYLNDKMKRGEWSQRITFEEPDNTEYRVKEYFAFTNNNSIAYWKRWA